MYYLIALFEGFAVMSVEILGAKMMAPYYGASLNVWASVIGVTLMGLAAGYFTGGMAAFRFRSGDLPFYLLLIAFLLMGLLPGIAEKVMIAMSDFPMRAASLLTAFFLLFPPLLFFGALPPAIIQRLTNTPGESGKTAGAVYTFSTGGGILAAFALGFFIIPYWGIKNPLFILTIITGAFPVVYFFRKRKFLLCLAAVFYLLLPFQATRYRPHPNAHVKFIARQEGMLGQLSVVELLQKSVRLLVINNITQTFVKIQTPNISNMDYIHNLAIFSSFQKEQYPHPSALLLGVGGGNLLHEITRMGFSVVAVEIDPRMQSIAGKYFAFQSRDATLFTDDARHFIHNHPKKYDLIIMDLLSSEVQPSHVFTLENFRRVKSMLNENGMLLINFQGYFMGSKGRGARSVLKTLLNTPFHSWVFYDGEIMKKEVADIFFIASAKPLQFQVNETHINECCRYAKFTLENLHSSDHTNLHDAIVLTDDKPALETLNYDAIMDWRKKFIRDYNSWKKLNIKVGLYE